MRRNSLINRAVLPMCLLLLLACGGGSSGQKQAAKSGAGMGGGGGAQTGGSAGSPGGRTGMGGTGTGGSGAAAGRGMAGSGAVGPDMFRWYPALTHTYWDATFDPDSKPAEAAPPNTASAPTQVANVQAFNGARRAGAWLQWTGNDPNAMLDLGTLNDVRVTIASGAVAASVSCNNCSRVLLEGPGKLCGFSLHGGSDHVVRGLVIDINGGEGCSLGFNGVERFALVCNAVLSDNPGDPGQSPAGYWEVVSDGLIAFNNIGVRKVTTGVATTNNWGIRVERTETPIVLAERLAFIDNWIMAGFQMGGDQGGQGPLVLTGRRFTLGHTPDREQRLYGSTGLYLGGGDQVRNEDVLDVGSIYHARTPDDSWHYGVAPGSLVDRCRGTSLVFYGPPTSTLSDRQREALDMGSTAVDYGIASATYHPVTDPYAMFHTLVCPEIGELPVSDPYQIRSQ